MKKYQYQVIRYMHDQFTGEFVNVGIILYSPEDSFLQIKVIKRYSRISQFFGGINGDFLLGTLRKFEEIIKEIAIELKTISNPYKRVDEITAKILVKDDSALQLSTEIFSGIDIDLNIALYDIFDRLVQKYQAEESISQHTDQYVWSKIYKRYFDQQGITKQLRKHSFVTEKDTIEFEKSWKNGVWNCYQPLSLDLKTEDSIKSKVYKWFGVIKQLETSNEPINLFFLTSTPHQHSELKPFIDKMLGTSNEPKLKVDLIDESEAAGFVATVRQQMEESGKINNASKDEDIF